MYAHQEKKLLAPLLDRLLDDSSNQKQNYQIIRQLRESVRRDIEMLFNSRIRCLSVPAGCVEINKSLPNFGLPDLSTINLAAQEHRKQFCRDVEKAILAHEPRIRSVKVKTQDRIDPENPQITFRIEAVLHANPAPEIIVFDSALDLITQSVDVSEIQ